MPGSEDNKHPQALVSQPVEQVAAEIAAYIRRLKADVVITFDPIGGYHHPDHIAMHRATVSGFRIASEPAVVIEGLEAYQPQKLYFQTFPRGLLKVLVGLMRLVGRDPRKFGNNKDVDLLAIAEVNFPTNAIIDYRRVADIRDEASRCHASQGGGSLTAGWFAPIRRIFSSKEIFMRAEPVPNGRIERDLFEGIVSLEPFRREVRRV
jgi:LmbE family N-acetylglucosaminyl deacetylase